MSATANLGYIGPGLAGFGTATTLSDANLALLKVPGCPVAPVAATTPSLVDVAPSGTVATIGTAIQPVIGVIHEGPNVAGDTCVVITAGIAKGKAGGTITMGDRLISDGAGGLTAVNLGTITKVSYFVGYALQDAAISDEFAMMVCPQIFYKTIS